MANEASRLCGISLEQYAGVLAATSEQIPLRDVLAQEGIAEDVWAAAERAWAEAIVDSSALELQLVQKRRIAEDCLGRKIEPLDTDPSAWVGVLGAIAAADDPDGLLGALGVTIADVSRLGRTWRKRAAQDPELAKKLVELAPKAKPPASVTVGPAVLRPFPWTVRKPPPPARPETPVPELHEEMRTEGPAPTPQTAMATYQLLELQRQQAPKPEAPAAPAEDPLDSTAAMPMSEVVRERIRAAEPSVAVAEAARRMPPKPPETRVPRSEEDDVCSGTAVAPAPSVIAARVKRALPFGSAASPPPSEPTPPQARPSSSRADDDPFNETAALPAPEVIRRRVAEAEPRVAMARAARDTPVGTEPRPPPEARAAPAHSDLDDAFGTTVFTSYASIAVTPRNASFAEQLTPTRVPEMSLTKYAALRAALTARGEDDVATWREFGVPSAAARDALRSMFAERFEREPAAREEFLRLVREARRAPNRGR